MIFDSLKKTAGPRVGRALLATKRNSPELYLAGGLILGASAAVSLAKAHKRSDDVLGPTLADIQAIREYVQSENKEAVEETNHEVISREDATELMRPLMGKLVLDAVKLYGPSIALGTGSVALILASRGIMKNRERALISSVALVQRGFTTYRKRVVDEFGAEVDERMYYGAEQRKIVTIEETKDGKTRKKRSDKNVIPEIPASQLYGRTFSKDTTPRWRPERDLNETWLRMQQSMANDKLLLYGVVFLNDVYEMLGFKKTAVGAVTGWCLDLEGGDDNITFGLDAGINRNQGDNRWMLDFNVEGYILDGVGNEEGPEVY